MTVFKWQLVLILLVGMTGTVTAKENIQNRNYIQVQVEAKKQVVATSSKLYLIIENMNRNLKQAQKKNKRIIKKIKKILKKYDIDDHNIIVDDYSTYPKEGFIPDSVQLSSRMIITIKDKNKVITLAKKIVDAINNVYIEQLKYEFEHDSVLKNKLTTELVKQMKLRQASLEEQLGIKLKIGNINETFKIYDTIVDQVSPIQNALMTWEIRYTF